ncbi:UDP-3-O-(3-hydroxymyristoyl)glucosamine N-acyltransferase [Porphyromonas circumdentaria]|uniref:UDP-3-O-acylglucosamine N-acyltransferase n=1 Tax=Porphyromonas circumdentaria TaxID=29524 RepID=A0A1T4NEV5_9PORP|nr:UDP-3-O-(3-hydroxymyristoyl)glucosamine N-acyltransferase [Porphyromonas circumdentaria]MBB6275650.1 UDP-3-O-[3-hydroxymyristoyl] glucosamine N-acyltransferase [Porphyromonas circumdentaria]MDO4721889.1 UDP-3-O-(3-hydroxymyristoyl)glucosamine N-acyltransferase [Porphyromonas circumdentaria]SJZ77537.1 UDP-3-O-[3-hydroxymyristoyl] glucosamine N-acyltransferase [Porphyromonas circumdentaria]
MRYTLKEIASLIEGTVEGDADATVSAFGKIEEAKEGELSFIANSKYASFLYTSEATAVLVSKDFCPTHAYKPALIRVENPYASLAKLMQFVAKELNPERNGIAQEAFIHPSVQIPANCYIAPFAYIEEGVVLGEGCSIYPHSYIGKDVTIGANTIIYPHVSIYYNCTIGSRCIVHAGSVIGSDGFGFAPTEDGYDKIPQLGTVKIEDDVEIGANTCIDRAVMGATVIGKGTKLDNLIQVAHNCTIGEHTVVASQSGMAGSSHLGSWCKIGGQAGIAGHITVGDRVNMGGQTGVLGNIKSDRTLLGSPAMDLSKALRAYTIIPKLPELSSRLSDLEKKLNQIESKLCNNKH